MKNKLFELFVCMLIVGAFFVVVPDTVRGPWGDGYTYTVSSGVATITGYNGSDSVITIPSKLGGYPTVTLGNYSFSSNLNLTSVTIPDSITTIGEGAFIDCFNLASVTIGNNVTTIGDYAFYCCYALTSVTIGNNVTTIGDSTFGRCYKLASVTIPDSVTTIKGWAFIFCAMTSVTIPNSVTTIGEWTFGYCSNLTSITIPDSVTIIGDSPFGYCPSLTAITVSAANTNYASDEGVLYNKTKTTLIQYPGGKAGAFSITGSVITIGTRAFAGCIHLTSVTIENNVSTIGTQAFEDCSNLTSVTIGNNVTTIGNNAFYICSKLNSVAIPDSVITIGDSAFYCCYALTSVTIGNNVTTIGDHAFDRCISLTSMNISDSVTTIGNYTFYGCPTLTSVTIGRSVITIGDYMFNYCSNLTSITFQGLVAPTTVGTDWIQDTPVNITGYAYAASNFPAPGQKWHNLTMGAYISGPPVIGTPSPTDGSTGNLLSFNWSVSITDFEGDLFNWTIECSNGQKVNGSNAINGTKSLALSGLANSKLYKVWVNATDPTGSNLYTRKWYTFTTKSSGGGGNGGEPSSENQNPVADLSVGEPYQGFVNSEITFDGSKSSDSDGNITKWDWLFGDNTSGMGETIQHTYSKAGTYTVTLTVTDNEGATNTDTTTCLITQQNRLPTIPIITGPTNGTKNTMYSYTVISTDADNDTLQYTFNWGDPLSTPQSSSYLPNGTSFKTNHSWASAGRYNITVTVTDNHTTSSSKITVYIDAKQTGDIGYLLDNNGDGIYDAFYSDELQEILAIQEKDGSYTIDSDGDGDLDYTYNATNGLTEYQTPLKPSGIEPVVLIGIIVVIVVICGIVLALVRKKGLI